MCFSGGFGFTEEMCVNYVHYYPKVQLEVNYVHYYPKVQLDVNYVHYYPKVQLNKTMFIIILKFN